ncbi:MAG TPA: hypothetical protein VNV66_12750 [Pilimelia sp.]|nr:hypothetical protein [Pilimelia sp.]
MAIRGALGAALVDYASGLAIRSAGHAPSDDHQVTTAGVARVVCAMLTGAGFIAPGQLGRVDDLVVTAGNGYHLVHFVTGRWDAPLALYVWLDRTRGNLAMTQRRVRAAVEELVAD